MYEKESLVKLLKQTDLSREEQLALFAFLDSLIPSMKKYILLKLMFPDMNTLLLSDVARESNKTK